MMGAVQGGVVMRAAVWVMAMVAGLGLAYPGAYAAEVKAQNVHWGSFEEILKTTDPSLTVEQFGRRFMTERYLAIWMANGRHYRLRFVDNTVDNIHLRIANDVLLFLQRTHELGTGLLNSVVALFSFAIILWALSAETPLPLFGVNLQFPGYLVFTALTYASIGTLVAHLIGWRLIPLQFSQQRYESDFRFAIARVTGWLAHWLEQRGGIRDLSLKRRVLHPDLGKAQAAR